jgi:hypothetical protein
MFHNLGIHWASSIPAFLTLIYVPMPYLFWKHGSTIRSWSKYSSEAAIFVARRSESHARKSEVNIEEEPPMDFTTEDEIMTTADEIMTIGDEIMTTADEIMTIGDEIIKTVHL